MKVFKVPNSDEVALKAYEYEKIYHGCAQCTLKALQDCFNFGSIRLSRLQVHLLVELPI